MDLEQRVAMLERRATRYRNALVMLVVVICAVAVVGATTDDGIVRGKAFYLFNDQGKIVVALGFNDGGDGLLSTYSNSGQELVKLTSTTGGDGVLTTYSNSGQELVNLSATTRGEGLLTTYSKSGHRLVYLGSSANDTGFLFEGYNKTGEAVVSMRVDDYGNGEVGAWNRKGKGRTLTSQ